MSATRYRAPLLLSLLALFVLAFTSVGATCGGPHRVAHVAIVASGSALASVGTAHRAAYEREAERVRAGVARESGTLGDYERRIAPARAAFAARGHALRALESALFGAAAINDAAAAGASPATYAGAARDLLAALEGALGVLGDGSVLPAVTIPPELTTVVRTLATLAAAVAPAPATPSIDGGPAGLPGPSAVGDAGDVIDASAAAQ